MTTLNVRPMLALLGGAALVAGIAVPAAAQPTPASLLCASAKQKAHGKTAAAILNCHSKAAKTGLEPVDPLCIQKAEDKWALAHDKAELKGGCAVEAQNVLFGGSDAGEKQGLYDLIVDETDVPADGLADTVVPLLRPNAAANACQGAKLAAAGKLAAGLLTCHANASKKGLPVDEIKCLAKVRAKLGDPVKGAFAKAELKGGCDTTGDAAFLISTIEGFVESALVGMPRNDGCGSGFTIAPETCDDGNVANADNCPSDCVVDPCTPNIGTDEPWTVQLTSPKPIAAVRVFLDYPEGKLSLPGSGDVTLGGDVTDVLDAPFTVASFNDQDHGVTGTVAEGTGSPTGFSVATGDLFTVHFETCNGAPAAAPGDFGCTVVDAADPLAKPLKGVTCAVN